MRLKSLLVTLAAVGLVAVLAVVLSDGSPAGTQRAGAPRPAPVAVPAPGTPQPAASAEAAAQVRVVSRPVGRRAEMRSWPRPSLPLRGRHDPHRVLVRLRPGTSAADRAAVARALGGRVERLLAPEGVAVVRLAPGTSVAAALARLRARPEVVSAEPNRAYAISATPNDPFFPGNRAGATYDLWDLQNVGQAGGTADADIDAPEAYDRLGETGTPWPTADYAVGVVDTGADAVHEDLSGKIVQPCFSATAGNGVLTPGCDDDNGHGTHVAGTIAATGNNGKGIVGVAPNARVYACKALDASGQGYDADIAACINQVVAARDAYHIRVLSLSLGSPDPSSTLSSAVQHAADNGILVVAAAGNDGNATLDYPAGYPSVVSVGATDRTDGHASFSNANAKVEVSAPGVDIISTYPFVDANGTRGDGYVLLDGTSMATPHAAAVAALIAARSGLSGQALRDRLDASVDDLGPAGRDPQFGFGRVNACLALGGSCTYRSGAVPAPSPAPTSTSPAPTSTAPAPAPTPTEPAPRAAPTPAPAPAPAPVTRSYRPNAYKLLTGRVYRSRGRLSRLYANEGSRLEIAAVRSAGRYLADLYASTTVSSALRASLRQLAVTYNGNASRDGSTVRLQAYDWTARRWITVDSRRVKHADRTFTWTVRSGASRYVSGAGAIRFRVMATSSGTMVERTDLVRFTLTTQP